MSGVGFPDGEESASAREAKPVVVARPMSLSMARRCMSSSFHTPNIRGCKIAPAAPSWSSRDAAPPRVAISVLSSAWERTPAKGWTATPMPSVWASTPKSRHSNSRYRGLGRFSPRSHFATMSAFTPARSWRRSQASRATWSATSC